MSITVNQIVLHQLVKHAENETTMMESVLRNELLTITPEAEQMMLQLHQGYQNKGKAFGVFQENSIFAQDLNRLLENEINFLNFSQQSTKSAVIFDDETQRENNQQIQGKNTKAEMA